LDSIVKTVDVLVTGFKNAFPVFNTFSNLVNGIAGALVSISGYTPAALPTIPSSPTNGPNITSNQPKNVTINVNKGNVTAKEIANAVNKGTKVGGAPILTGTALRNALRN
jgi:phage-related protein